MEPEFFPRREGEFKRASVPKQCLQGFLRFPSAQGTRFGTLGKAGLRQCLQALARLYAWKNALDLLDFGLWNGTLMSLTDGDPFTAAKRTHPELSGAIRTKTFFHARVEVVAADP